MIRALAALTLALTAVKAVAEPLTVGAGETWLFSIEHGDPSHARKVGPGTAAARNEVKVSVRALFGTMMTISNNSPQGYSFQAELIGKDGKSRTARTCSLPPDNQPALETWPEKVAAVRIGSFKPTTSGRC